MGEVKACCILYEIVSYAVIPVYMLCFTGYTIEVFKFASKYFKSVLKYI